MLILLAGDVFVEFCSGMRPNPEFSCLLDMWRAEHKGLEERKRRENFYKSKYPEDYERAMELEEIFVNWTPNVKQMWLDFLDGKCDAPDWKHFEEALNDAREKL